MRSLRTSSILTLIALVVSAACDPGSGDVATAKKTGGGGTTSSTPAAPVNPLLRLPDVPPGEVNMTPPAAGELDVFEQNRALGRGMNLGNGLDSPRTINWGLVLMPYMYEVIKEAGFDSIRLPVKWSDYASNDAPYTIEPTIFEKADKAIAHALTRDLRVVLDIHHFGLPRSGTTVVEEGIYDQPEKYHDKFLALWQQIATHYRDYPKELYFEVLNEPRGTLEGFWNQYLAEAVAIIRESNPGRTLVVGGVEYNKWYRLKDVTFPTGDNNIIATFHYYNPYCFCMQDPNQTWEALCKPATGTASAAGAISWPVIYPKIDPNPDATSAATRAQIETDLANAAAWGKSANRPLYMGEFGVMKTANETARVDYTTSLVRAAEKNGIVWSYWEFGAPQYGIWDQGKLVWNQLMLNALIPTPSEGGGGSTGAAGSSNAGGGGTAGNGNATAGSAGLDEGPSTAGTLGSGGVGGTN